MLKLGEEMPLLFLLGSRIRIQIQNFKTGSADPDLVKIGPDPQHWNLPLFGKHELSLQEAVVITLFNVITCLREAVNIKVCT